MHEVLVSEEEMWRAKELKKYYLIPSWARSQDKKTPEGVQVSEYSSAGTHLLTREEILTMLKSDGWFGPDARKKAVHGIEIDEN
jgi:hypothetical protein